MSPPSSTDSPSTPFRGLFAHPLRWLLPAVVVAGAGAAFALVHTPSWEAWQAWIIRNEATGDEQRSSGKFKYPDEMKTVQETILELVRSQSVLSGALAQVGPPAGDEGRVSAWPGPEDVADLRDRVKLTPPKGAEFGKTEVFYLKVQDQDRQRAVALVAAIATQLEAGFQQLRDARARSMIDELVKTVGLARADLTESTGRLSQIETQVGSDLAELRQLQDGTAGDSALRRTVTEIRTELRQARTAVGSTTQLLALLKEVQEDPHRLAAIPNQLIESQPALRRLKEGMADAQLRTAQLTGGMSENHPLVQAARESEREIQRNLHNELATAMRGLQIDLRLSGSRATMLDDQLAKTTARLEKLSALRAAYANQVAETRNRTVLLERAEQGLAEARASQSTAMAASLIARIDVPDAGTKPAGPGRGTIALGGIACGLLAGLGVVF